MGGWCLSLDNHEFTGNSWDPVIRSDGSIVRSGACYQTLIFKPDGNVWGHHGLVSTNPNAIREFVDFVAGWGWGRRRSLLEEEFAALPTVADFNACEADDSIPDAECDALVDQILTWEMEHSELREDAESSMEETESSMEAEGNFEENRRQRRKL